MRIQTRIVNLTEPERDQFKEYLDKKVDSLRPILEAHYPDEDTVKMDVHIEKFDKHTAFRVEFVLDMPRTHQRLVAEETKHSITEPMDAVTSKLEAQIVKHFKRLTHD